MPTFQNDQWQEALVSIANTGISTTPPADIFTTGTISAAQSGINTPIASATVVLAVGTGQSTWKAQLTNGGGGFTSGTTIVADKSMDSGTTWFSASFKVSGGSPATTVSTVVGPGPLEITGSAADVSHVRIRCSVLNATETIAVNLRAGTGIVEMGLMSSIPAGTNKMGGVTIADGDLTTLGAQADASAAADTSTASYISLFKRLLAKFPSIGPQAKAASQAVTIATDDTLLTNTTGLATQTTLASVQTNTANIPAKGSATSANSTPVVIASDQAAVKTKGDFVEQTSLTAASLNADLVASIDVSAYKWWSLHILTIASGATLSFQGSNDNVTFVAVPANSTASTSGLFVNTTTAGIYHGPVVYRYLRIRQTAWTSGSSTGVLELYTTSASLDVLNSNALQSGTWTVQPGNTQNTTPWLIQGPTTTGVQAANTAGNVVIKGSAGALWSAVITATGTAGLDIFDNATTNSGTKILSIPANAAVGTIYNFLAGQPAANGIVSAGVANCPAVTFGYR